MRLPRRLKTLLSPPRSSKAGSWNDVLALLPPGAESLAVLAGAGISLDSPSNLLAGWHFMDAVLSRILPADVPPKVAQSLISVPKNQRYRPGEYIRFETLMMQLAQSGIDEDLHVLDCLDLCEHPNSNHYVLAELIRRGSVVLTTNFDRLIEIAYERSRKPGEPVLRVVYDDAQFPADGPQPVDGPTLWKLHGTLSVDGQSTRASLQATIVQIMWPSMTRNKTTFLAAVIAARDTVLVGYSGSDDLDVVPVLADTPSARAMLWVEHASGNGIVRLKTARDVVAGQETLTQYEVVGRDRVLFVRGTATAENPDKVALVSGNTSDFLRHLQQRYCPDLSISCDGAAEFEFGARHFEAVRGYFDRWAATCSPRMSTRYNCALALLGNRSFRDDVGTLTRRLRDRRRELIAGPKATAEERLDFLMDEFNSTDHPDPPTQASFARNQQLLDAIQQLVPALPPALRGEACRLSACALSCQGRQQEAAEAFRRAWTSDRALGNLPHELATLTTWQRGTNSLRDHLSEREHHAFNALAESCGQPIFPDDAFYRLRELAEETGYKLNVWTHLIQTFDLGYVEEDAERKRLVHREARAMLRAAIDLGDVVGEVKARLLLALSLQDAHDFDEATMHIVCLLELGKVIELGELQLRALALLGQMGTESLARNWRPAFARAMWA
jgi:hypothetical protein